MLKPTDGKKGVHDITCQKRGTESKTARCCPLVATLKTNKLDTTFTFSGS